QDEIDDSMERRVLTGAAAAKEISSFDYGGGYDNYGALSRGFEIADSQPGSVLVWIHGPQPVLLGLSSALIQERPRQRNLTPWYELQVVPGQNRITEDLEEAVPPETLRADEMPRLISMWQPGGRRVVVSREHVAMDASTLPASQKTSDHLVRLWANDEIG